MGITPARVVPPKRLSRIPTLVALVLVVVGLGLAVVVLRGMNSDATLTAAIAGYLIAPFCTSACLIWARTLDLRNQSNAAYLKVDGQVRLRTLGIVVLVSFIPAIAFIWYIASYVGSVLA